MSPATVIEVRRGSAHQREVDMVRASLLRGVEFRGERRTVRPLRS